MGLLLAAGGSSPASLAPSWATSLTLDAWTALSTVNAASDVAASDSGQYGNSGPSSVFTAWSGAALVSGFGSKGSILHWGGGHQDYYGNEVYSFDLNTLTWSRMNDPSSATWSETHTNGILPDGKPRVPHTYYDISSDGSRLITAKRELDNQGGNTTTAISVFNPSTLAWTTYTDTPTLTVRNYDGFVYDSSRDLFWKVTQQPVDLASVDADVGTWTEYTNPAGNYNNRAGSVYVPTKDCIISFPDGAAFGLDPGNPTNARVDITTSGTGPASFGLGDMAHWSGNLGAIVYYPSRSNTLYTLTPPAGDWTSGTWTWAQPSLTGTTGTHDSTTPTLGKFQVVEWGTVTVAMVNGDWDGAYRAVRLN